MIGIQMALNVVLNLDKRIVHALVSEPNIVMQAGVPISRQVCQVAVEYKYGMMISSPGGNPKVINVYQAQKGLAHAAQIIHSGGMIILTAACPDGTGSRHYENWATSKASNTEVIEKFCLEGFLIDPHKVYQIARDASQIRLMFFSKMNEDQARALLLNPVQDLKIAADMVLADLQPGELVGMLPYEVSTIPYSIIHGD